jgi:hypothetical protein
MDTTNPPSAQSSIPEWREIRVAAVFEDGRTNAPVTGSCKNTYPASARTFCVAGRR